MNYPWWVGTAPCLFFLAFSRFSASRRSRIPRSTPRSSSRISPGPSCGPQSARAKPPSSCPIGGTEQNGPAMALGKHNRRVKLLSERIAVSLGDAIVAPVIAYVPEGNLSPPSGHMRFPGTISAPEAAFETILEYAARSFKEHGFKDIVFLGDHGGYQANEKNVANKVNREWFFFECARARCGAVLRGGANRFCPNSEGPRVHAFGDWNPRGSERHVADARA